MSQTVNGQKDTSFYESKLSTREKKRHIIRCNTNVDRYNNQLHRLQRKVFIKKLLTECKNQGIEITEKELTQMIIFE